MKKLFFFAVAFAALGLIAYFVQPSEPVLTPKAVGASRTGPSVARNAASAPAATPVPVARPEQDGAIPSTESAALGYLQSASKRSWDLKRDDFGNHIRTLSAGEMQTSTVVPREAGEQFVKFYSKGLFGVDAEQIKFDREEVTDRTRLIYRQVVNGVPVYGGLLVLFYENGSLTRVQNDLAPFEVEAGSKPSAVENAFAAYQTQSSDFNVSLQDHQSNQTILVPNGHSLVYATEFVTRERVKDSSAPAQSFHVVYDSNHQFVIQRRPSAIR